MRICVIAICVHIIIIIIVIITMCADCRTSREKCACIAYIIIMCTHNSHLSYFIFVIIIILLYVYRGDDVGTQHGDECRTCRVSVHKKKLLLSSERHSTIHGYCRASAGILSIGNIGISWTFPWYLANGKYCIKQRVYRYVDVCRVYCSKVEQRTCELDLTCAGIVYRL